ncbi:MAG: hypothetical protein OXI41_00060 [Chloroflexota bacterium]|nr:hypothetical protein [Chloroflexota bacterium]MDE2895670.1 hypothetical protein [Chloroflexota bacterium]
MQGQTAQVGVVMRCGARQEAVEQLTQEEILADLAANGFTEERLQRIFEESDRNDEFFRAHEEELFAQHPDKILIIHSGGIVETFENATESSKRYHELDLSIRDGAIIRRQYMYEGYLVL